MQYWVSFPLQTYSAASHKGCLLIGKVSKKPHVISHIVVTEYKKKKSAIKKKKKKKSYNTWLYYEVSHDQNIYNKKGTYCVFWREIKIIDGQTDWRVHIMKNAVYMHLTGGDINKSNIELNPMWMLLILLLCGKSFQNVGHHGLS